ncbi:MULTISPECIES: Imm50 family immunity protein [unclassified Streptomyces]|uniref:Imm50 family immunity protein n=1 Tax=unclassified Streptomyces TaxID=2593676 RepID=UPI0033A46DA0
MTDDLDLLNADDLVDLYGSVPPLKDIRLRSINMNWRGPTITLRVDISSFPAEPPQDWEYAEVDTVQCHLQFLAVENFSLSDWDPPTPSASLVVTPLKKDRKVQIRLTGIGVDLCFTSHESVRVGHVSAFRSAPDGTDGGPHLFLRNLDRRRHTTVPETEEKTFYERI